MSQREHLTQDSEILVLTSLLTSHGTSGISSILALSFLICKIRKLVLDWPFETKEDSMNPLNVMPSFVCIFINAGFFLRSGSKSKVLMTADFGTYDSGGRSNVRYDQG